MKNLYLLVSLSVFFLSLSNYSFSQYIITEDTYDNISESSDIIIMTEGEDITIQGEYYCVNPPNREIYGISIIPNDGNSISILPAINNRNEEETDYSRLGCSEEDIIKRTIDLYPNPSRSIIHLDTEKPYTIINVFSVYGIKQNIYKENGNLNIETYKNGVYFIKLQFNNGETLIKKFVKN